jgi:two-component system sensor histidine kinase KdpD
MKGIKRLIGVMGVHPGQQGRFQDADELSMLEACANLVALSLERDQLMVESHAAQTQIETEQLRNSLLTSISHDLRSPLATIAVTTQGLLDEGSDGRISEKREVLETIVDETRQLGRQVDNLLDWGRLNSAATPLARDWQVLDELVGVALSRVRRELAGHQVRIDLPADLPLLWVADDLIVQVLVNLLSNAARYTPSGSCIEISARRDEDRQEIVIADNGPGIPAGSEEAIFEKFVRGAAKVADGRRGLGLGLSICRSIVAAHGGTIRASNRPAGGAEFVISLPCPTDDSAIRLEEAADIH